MMVRNGQSVRSVAEALFATILLQNRLHRDGDCSVLCTTRKAETGFGFNYLQFMGLYSKFPELAFNQWVAGSSPARLIQANQQLAGGQRWPLYLFLLGFAALI